MRFLYMDFEATTAAAAAADDDDVVDGVGIIDRRGGDVPRDLLVGG
jgi:hypothetical protein